jgi:protein gp37
VAANVPFFFKQWGDFAPLSQVPATDLVTKRVLRELPMLAFPPKRGEETEQLVYRVGNDAAGAKLDGQEWRQMPRLGAATA